MKPENRIPTRPRCHRCERYITIDTIADKDLWAEVIGAYDSGYICADCFTRAADERLIEWVGRVRFVPLCLVGQMGVQANAKRQTNPAIHMIPSIGRIVHFVLPDGQHRPAIIVRVWDDIPTPESLVQLQVFTDGENDGLQNVEWRTSVQQHALTPKPGTWHEPERSILSL